MTSDTTADRTRVLSARILCGHPHTQVSPREELPYVLGRIIEQMEDGQVGGEQVSLDWASLKVEIGPASEDLGQETSALWSVRARVQGKVAGH